jgi:homogentisate 1,2-dioxygenase
MIKEDRCERNEKHPRDLTEVCMTSHALPAGMIRAAGVNGTLEGYMPGFGNDFETEALPGALPIGRNSPQKCSYGLYGEQLSGTAFTAPSHQNERTWCYRIRPSVKHSGRYRPLDLPLWRSAPDIDPSRISLGQYRWDPLPHAREPLTWLSGMRTMTTAGDVNTQAGMASHVYLVTRSMKDEYFSSADGELLVVPQEGRLRFCTELGIIDLEPKEIAILPRGLVYRVELLDGPARGFVCENYGQKFELPGRGPIGANCMANRRDFKTPVAAFEDREVPSRLVMKWCGHFYETQTGFSPLDVVAWHGNYAPVKYDMRHYCPIGSILFDHPDPSIFTVLTAPSGVPGTANIDFVLFRERWMVMEDTFRPPWYHKNVMSELMGNIYGQYDAKPQGFVPGGISLHNCMLPHGPDLEAFEKASNGELRPHKLDETMSFMFETRFPQHLTQFAANTAPLQDDYADCWKGLEKKFDGTPGRK